MKYRASDRSLLEIDGDIDYNAPAVQVLYSPVTGTPISLTALMEGSLFPRRWRIVRVLEIPPAPIPWSTTVGRLGGSTGTLDKMDPAPLPSAMTAFVNNVKKAFTNSGLPVVLIVGSLVVLFYSRKK